MDDAKNVVWKDDGGRTVTSDIEESVWKCQARPGLRLLLQPTPRAF